MQASFKPLPRAETAVDGCERVLRQKILQGEIKPGERLPPERQMADAFGVNRVTLRGALGRLVAARLLRVRQGRGYEVLDFQRSGGPGLLSSLLQLAAEQDALAPVVEDLLLVRRHLAAALIERLIQQAAPPLGALRRSIDEFACVVADGASDEDVARADLAIVAELVSLTGSSVLALCLNPILELLTRFGPLRQIIYAEPLENVAAYRALLVLLEDPPPQAAEKLNELLRLRDVAALERLADQAKGSRKT